MSSEVEINNLVEEKLKKIKNYLNSQSISELEKINSNVSKFIEEQFIDEKNRIDLLNHEINKQTKINNTKANLLNFEKKVKELEKQKNELAEKAINKSKFMNEIKTQIEERFNLPKNKLISDLINQSITYPEFMQKFKNYSMKYNYYNDLLLELDKNT
jgi:hypothetical protein